MFSRRILDTTVNLFKNQNRMSMIAIERIIANNKVAEESLALLKREFCAIKNEKVIAKIDEITKENESLRKQVETAKMQLIKLETANGKPQIPVPNRSGGKVEEPAQQQPEAVQKSEVKTDHPKKDKPKKEKAPAAEKPKEAPEAPMDVGRLDMRVGKIVEVSLHPDAESLYLEKIDCGEANVRTVVSGLVKHIPLNEMENRMVIVLCNLKPAKMRGVVSEAMVMCASSPDKVEVMSPPAGSVPGDLISCEGFIRNPDAIMNPKKKIFETVSPDLLTNDAGVGCYKGIPLFVQGKGPITSQTLKNVNIK
ncbi:unnamed protein product [Diamesa tonsa]